MFAEGQQKQDQGYDPTNPTPYVAPEIAPPRQSPVAPPSQPFQFSSVPISKLGAVAGVLDNVFRGYMQGKAQHADKVAQEFKTKTNNLQASHAQDVQRLDALMKAGVSPTSEEYKTAKAAAQGSWESLMDWSEKVAIGPDGDKKRKSSKKKPDQAQQPQQASPFGQPPQTPQQQMQEQKKQAMQQLYQDAQSTDPKVKVAALWKIRKLMGPAINYQTQMYESPEYQAQLKATKDTQGIEAQTQPITATNALSDAQHQQVVNQARTTVDELRPKVAAYENTPQSQWTAAQKQQYDQYKQAESTYNESQRKTTGATHLYQSPDKTSQEYYIPGNEPEGWQPAQAHAPVAPKAVTPKFGAKGVLEGISDPNSGKLWTLDELKLGAGGDEVQRQYKNALEIKRQSGSGSGSGGAGGKINARFNQWVGYFKHQGLDQAHAEAKARVKVEGAASVTADAIAKEYSEDPYGFDSDVLKRAMTEVIQDPTNGYWDTEKKEPKPWVKDAFANVLGYNEDDNTYQYRKPQDWKVLQPNSDKKYSGNVTKEQIQKMDSQLQQKIQAILLKQKGLTPDEVSEAKKRMRSLFGYIPTDTGTPSESPQTAGKPAGAASSRPSAGETKQSKGEVWKTDFLKENPGATDAEWNTMKVQLKSSGYEPVDK